jgi:pimeloyl-ACP methyl ester carboxylesterase
MSSSGTATRSDDNVVAPSPGSRRIGIGWIVVAALFVGLATAVLLPFVVPVTAADENFATAMILFGFAVGWALLAGLSTRLSDQPQRWAMAPAVFMGLSGVMVLLGPHALVNDVLAWVWPPALLVLVVWMFRRARRELHSRTRGLLLYPVLAVLLLFSVGGIYEKSSESIEGPVPAMHGQLVNVGDHRLHLDCTGSGSPTVVLEPGGGAMSSDMALIAPVVARGTRVCVYDRPGRGTSDPVAIRQDGAKIATDLHVLLHRGHVPGPYVLAGHSFGGLYVMSFAAKYPREVAGLVLVDSTAPKFTPVPSGQPSSNDLLARASAIASSTAHLGLGRLIRSSYSTLPPKSRDEARASSATGGYLGSWLDEFGSANRSTSEAGKLDHLRRGKPLIVLTAGSGSNATWMAAQNKMATLSSDSLHRFVAGATHDDLVSDPKDAAVVSNAIHHVVASVRTSTPLTDH